MSYLCSVFFMVLDLRLTESRGCRETVPIRFYMVGGRRRPTILYKSVPPSNDRATRGHTCLMGSVGGMSPAKLGGRA